MEKRVTLTKQEARELYELFGRTLEPAVEKLLLESEISYE